MAKKGKKFTISFDRELKKGTIAGDDGERSTKNISKSP